jgi:hypothetical protein
MMEQLMIEGMERSLDMLMVRLSMRWWDYRKGVLIELGCVQ